MQRKSKADLLVTGTVPVTAAIADWERALLLPLMKKAAVITFESDTDAPKPTETRGS